MATDISSDTSSRFSIYVPSPSTRVNLGKPDPDSPFGYKGISLQADANMFVDINKVVIFQSWKDATFQAVGKWTQWADAGMWLGSVNNTTVTSGAKMLLVAGASQSRDMLLDHGMSHVTPRIVEYNNLELHYRVEEVHNGLKKFFYGAKWKTPEKAIQGPKTVDFTALGPAQMVGVLGQQADFDTAANYPADGFLKKLHTLLEDLGYDDDLKGKFSVLQPLEWEGDYLDMGMDKASVYSALRTFDPYPAQGFSGPWTLVYAGFVQVINWLKRTVDVMRRLASGITENALLKRVQALITAWGNAQDGINNILNSADIARFDRDTQKAGTFGSNVGAFEDESGSFGKRILKPSSASAAKAAELSSLPGPFDISSVSAADAYIDVLDRNDAATKTRLDFSEFLTAQRAKISLTVSDSITSMTVSTSAVSAPTVATPTVSAVLTLNGAAVTFTRTAVLDPVTGLVTSVTDAWGALPAGFQLVTATVSKTDGSPFSASVANGITVTDASFGAGDSLTVTIDGTPYAVSLSGINAPAASATVAADRASRLVSAINGQHGGAASAAGNVVTIQSDQLGSHARVEASATAAVTRKLTGGASALALSDLGSDPRMVLISDLAAKLAGAGKTFTLSSGATVKITHNVLGATSYIEISGKLAVTFFGANPAKASGADEKTVSSWAQFSDMRNLQFEIAKWPEDVRHLIRPVTDALNDVVSGLSKVSKDVFDNLMTAIIGVQPKTMALGLIAKDGITLGTSKAIYGAGQSITFVAAPPSDPDDDKFVPGFEKLANFILTFGDAWTKAQWDKFKPLKKKPGAEPKGDFRIVAAQDILSTAGRNVRHVALDTSWLEGGRVAVHSKTQTLITCRTGQVHVQAKSVVIGDVLQDGTELKQAPTESILLQCQDKLDLYTTDLRLQLDNAGSKIRLGKRVLPAVLPPAAVDETKPHLLVDLANGAEEVKVGFTTAGGNTFGLSVAHDGKVKVNADTTLALSVQGGAAVTVGAADVSIAKKFKVGTALLVQGDGVFTQAPRIAMAQVLTRPPLIIAEYAQAIIAATVQKGLITACDVAMTSICTMVTKEKGVAVAYATLAARPLYDTQDQLRQAAINRLLIIHGQWQQLIDESRLYDMTPVQLGRIDPLHPDLFVVPVPPPRP